MLSGLSSIIIREIILRFDDYQSIINFKMINKRFFKFIEYDIVIQRYYLLLKYNLILKDEDLFKYIKLLDSKCYSKLINQNLEIKNTFFVNPTDDTFIHVFVSNESIQAFTYSEQNLKCERIINFVLEKGIGYLKQSMISEGYFLLNYKDNLFINDKSYGRGNTGLYDNPKTRSYIVFQTFSEYDQRILENIKLLTI